MTSRRSTRVIGYVLFPVTSKAWRNTDEGGMFVHLVVVPPSDYERVPTACFGCDAVSLIYREVLLGHDIADSHFPNVNNDALDPLPRYTSRPYLAAVLLGSTGWSGWSERRGSYWRCTLRDLTPDGRRLYDSLRKLYPRCRLELLTWLDT